MHSLTLAKGHKEACNKQASIWFETIERGRGEDGRDGLMGRKNFKVCNVMQACCSAAFKAGPNAIFKALDICCCYRTNL